MDGWPSRGSQPAESLVAVGGRGAPLAWLRRSRLPFGPRSQASLQKAQGPGLCKLPKPPASRALCQAKRAPRAAFPSGCLAAQTKRWAEGISQGSHVSMRVARGSASWLSSHGRGLGPRDALKKDSRGLCRGAAGRRSNPGLLNCRWILHQLSHQGSPGILQWIAYTFSRESYPPRN